MELKELKNLIKEYHECENLKENNNLDGFVAKFRQQEIFKTLQTHAHYFSTTANVFQKNLREMFEQKQNIKYGNLNFQTQIKNIQIDNDSKFYIYQIKPSIQIKTKHEIKKHKLPEFVIVSKSELEDKDFTTNNYELSLLSFLLQTNPETNKTLHLTCWNIVSNNLFKELSID